MKTRLLVALMAILCVNYIYAQEFGTDDFRISDSNGVGWSTNNKATNPATAYNSTNDQYLVVWEADDTDFDNVVNNEKEIIGQIIDSSGNEIGSDFIISSVGGYGNANFDANHCSITYNPTNNEYLVVYSGDRTPGEDEIYGVIVNADGSVKIPDFRISNQGTDGDVKTDAFEPDVVYNEISNNYLVVWEGDNTTDNEYEIWGQIIDTFGNKLGNDFRISNQGPEGDHSYDTYNPDIAWNSSNNEYLIIWDGDNTIAGEEEIFGQRLTSTGDKIGSNFRISNQGNDGDENFDAMGAKISYNPINDNYLTVWFGDRTAGEDEIYGQLLSNTGTKIGVGFKISNQGTDGDIRYGAVYPSLAWKPLTNSYEVVWTGDTSVIGEKEIFIQEISALGALKGNRLKISSMGPEGNKFYDALDPTIVSNSEQGVLIAWEGNDDSEGLLSNEFEIFIQMYGNPALSTEETLFEQETSIYPNPNNGVFTLQYSGNEDLEKATVFNVTGKTVTTISLQGFNQSKTINLQNIAKGIYLIKVESNQRSITQKILIK